MTVLGILLLIAGGASAIYGFQMNNSVKMQLDSILNSGSVDPGTMWIIIGVVLAVVGLVVLVTGMQKKNES